MSKALILAGAGYTLQVAPEAEQLKLDLLESSKVFITVTDSNSCSAARQQLRMLADFRNNLEKSRKAVKEPVLKVGKDIDAKAEEFGRYVYLEEKRIEKLVQDFALEQEKIRRFHEEELRKAAAEQERLRQAEEKARQEAELARLRAERLKTDAAKDKSFAAEQAALEEANLLQRQQEESQKAAQLAAEEAAFSVQEAEGTKTEYDYEVVDLQKTYVAYPHLVDFAPKRGLIMERLKAMKKANFQIKDIDIPGLKIIEKVVVNKR